MAISSEEEKGLEYLFKVATTARYESLPSKLRAYFTELRKLCLREKSPNYDRFFVETTELWENWPNANGPRDVKYPDNPGELISLSFALFNQFQDERIMFSKLNSLYRWPRINEALEKFKGDFLLPFEQSHSLMLSDLKFVGEESNNEPMSQEEQEEWSERIDEILSVLESNKEAVTGLSNAFPLIQDQLLELKERAGQFTKKDFALIVLGALFKFASHEMMVYFFNEYPLLLGIGNP